jgi:hypothetical protein
VDTGAILRFNNKAHESLGYTREEFAALKMADFELDFVRQPHGT